MSFPEAAAVFEDEAAVIVEAKLVRGEIRFAAIGRSSPISPVLLVVHNDEKGNPWRRQKA